MLISCTKCCLLLALALAVVARVWHLKASIGRPNLAAKSADQSYDFIHVPIPTCTTDGLPAKL